MTHKKGNRVANELWVLLYNFFNAFLLTILCLIVFEVKDNFGSSANGLSYKMMIAVMMMSLIIFILQKIK